MYSSFIKNLSDFVIALLGLIAISPLIITISMMLTLSNYGFPFFIQPRPGKNGKIFKLVKFKTMNDRKDSNGNLLPDKDRLTKVGKVVRSLSLDELPQLWNVLKGEMSLIGPRPLLVKYLPLYTKEQARRHEVRPGITGWAQVNGRNAISWDEKFKLDAWYVDHVSFFLDMKILWMTFLKVIKREGINSSEISTMPPFTGSHNINS